MFNQEFVVIGDRSQPRACEKKKYMEIIFVDTLKAITYNKHDSRVTDTQVNK